MGGLIRKAVGKEQSQSKRQAVKAINRKTIRSGLLKPQRAHITPRYLRCQAQSYKI
jgi:hypothetical protein